MTATRARKSSKAQSSLCAVASSRTLHDHTRLTMSTCTQHSRKSVVDEKLWMQWPMRNTLAHLHSIAHATCHRRAGSLREESASGTSEHGCVVWWSRRRKMTRGHVDKNYSRAYLAGNGRCLRLFGKAAGDLRFNTLNASE